MARIKVFVAMSGGVDSSVAALLLKRQGYDVTGVFMRCYNIDGCAETDSEDARRVAEKLHIPFFVWDFEKEYKRRVVDYMVRGYKSGITPNPDVMCNKEIKFGIFFDRARKLGADFVATGHYVRLRRTATRNKEQGTRKLSPMPHAPSPKSLFIARDAQKDQSYFLWTLRQEQLAHCLFPIGNYIKSEVRKIARRAKLPTADKKDSQGICFLGQFDLKAFLKRRIRARKGDIVTLKGLKIGEHDGAEFYTIGQRRLGLSLRVSGDSTKPHYVAIKDVKTNKIVVAEGEDNPALFKKIVNISDVNLVSPVDFKKRVTNLRVMARVRYRQPLARAILVIRAIKKGAEINCRLLFSRPVKFVASGQSAVFYSRKGELLGGGIII